MKPPAAKRNEELLIKSIKNTSIIILIRISVPNQDSIVFGVKRFGRMNSCVRLS